jgi:hypothetical protein
MQPCHETAAIGGCQDYQFRMITSPLTLLVILFLLNDTLKWRTPCLMLFPYFLGRLVTGISTSFETEINIATPLLVVAYAWGYIAYSRSPTTAALTILGLTLAMNVLLRTVAVNALDFVDENTAAQAAILGPVIVACVMSWITLARHKNWYWFAGLAWGIGVPVILPCMGYQPYESLSQQVSQLKYFQGPMLWYSDALLTLPLAIYGQVAAGQEGKPVKLIKEE